MKKLIGVLFLFCAFTALAQNKDEIAVLANTRALHFAVFQKKDSVTLDRLFARELTYGHSGGKLENREEAIHNISNNQSTYADLEMGAITLYMEGNTAVTRHQMMANEMTKDGKTNALKLNIVLVWKKEKKKWMIMARQAVKVS